MLLKAIKIKMAENKTPRKKKGKSSRAKEKPQTPGSSKTPNSKSHVDVFAKSQDPPYEDYWTKEAVSAGLKRGELIKGTLRINQKDFSEAYIDDPSNGPDYFIPVVWGRNRALDGDEVVVQVMPSDKWEPYRQDSKDEERLFDKILSSLKLVDIKSESSAPGPDSTPSTNSTSLPADSSPNHTATEAIVLNFTSNTLDHSQASDESVVSSPNDPSSDSSHELPPEDTPTLPTLIDALYTCKAANTQSQKSPKENPCGANGLVQDGKDLRKLRRTTKVVYIITDGHSRACAGMVKIFNKVKGLGLFSPTDPRVPRVVVPLSDLPPDFPKNHGKYQSTLFVCRIMEWKNESLFPNGRVLRSLGEAGEIEPETASILTEYDIDDEEFPPEVLECLPKLAENGKWKASEEELKKRRDFREDCVVSIDPSTARDLDDALHCKEVSPGVFEVGVHIADVSHFMAPKTALDKMAADRATSVYLVQRVIPMLPRQLCEDLCSLNPHEEKLTFSVVWRLTLKGELLDEWMGKSVICSRAKLSYEEAQLMIDQPDYKWTKTDFPNIADEESVPLVVRSVVKLNRIAKQLRFLRQSRGTLRLDQPKLCFSLDKETGLPNGCHVYRHKESNKLIEEFMLLANMAVAHKISNYFPDISLLRQHPPPKSRGVETLRDQCKTLGIVLDLSSAGQLQKSLSQYSTRRSGNEAVGIMEKQLLTNLCCKTMELARYFCTGCIEEENFLHYALNVPRYTHFTSPIRRYADVVVHRLLAAALNQGPRLAVLTEDVEEQAQHCNKRRKNAKIVEEFSSNLFLGVFIRECGPLKYPGMVQAVLNKAFDVYIPDLAVIKRIYCEKLPLSEFKYEPPSEGKEPSLLLVWKAEEVKDKKSQVQILKVFTPVEVSLSSRNKTLQFDAVLEPQEH